MESKKKDEEQISQEDMIILKKILYKYTETREFINEIGVQQVQGVLCFLSYCYADLFLILKYDEKEIDGLVKVCRNSGKKMLDDAVNELTKSCQEIIDFWDTIEEEH